MKNWIVELTIRGKRFAEAKICRGIFKGDALSRLLFVIAMMTLNYIFQKYTGGYKLRYSQKKIAS